MSAADLMPIGVMDIEDASKRIAGKAVHTPLINSPVLDAELGASIWLKLENFQRSGSFKFRGAYNRLAQLTQAERQKGVVAWSSGNHAQGIAEAAKILRIPATIVMPADAPKVKVENTKALGAEIVFYDRYKESREEIGEALATRRGATLVPSFDDPHIIAGQGTCGLEIAQEFKSKRGTAPHAVLVCCGGGGLIAGSSLAIKSVFPSTKVYAVEPEDFDDHRRSLVAGERLPNSPDARSICDALLAPRPGELTFPINKTTLEGGLAVSDAEVKQAMRFAYRSLKLVIEPGGVVALAALLSRKIDVRGKSIVAVVSGGNVDPALFANIICEEPTHEKKPTKAA